MDLLEPEWFAHGVIYGMASNDANAGLGAADLQGRDNQVILFGVSRSS